MINLCLVGTGGIATQHMKALTELGATHTRWVISRRKEAAQQFAQEWAIENFGITLQEALADPAVDLVLVTSPNEVHFDQTVNSLEAGKDVIVEIPVALSLAQAARVARVAAELKRRVQVCHTMRSFSAIREVRRRVTDGQLHLSHIAGFFAIPRRHNQSWAGQRSWIDNLLWHHGCHQVDAAMWVLGVERVRQIGALIGRAHKKFGMAMDVSIHFRTEARQLVTQALTYNADELCWELRFFGDEEVLTFRNGRLFNEKKEDVVPQASWLDLIPQNRQMLAAIREGDPSDYDIESVLPAMEVLQQAQSSAETEPDLDSQAAASGKD